MLRVDQSENDDVRSHGFGEGGMGEGVVWYVPSAIRSLDRRTRESS